MQICNDCQAPIRLRVAGVSLEEFYASHSTVVAKEGEDVAFNWPGEG